MHTEEDIDKSGQDLKAQRFQMLTDIAEELRGDVVFPTCFDVAVRLRKLLADENASIDQIVALIVADPLISVRLLRVANSVAFNPSGRTVRDVKSAVTRVGLKTVRNVTMSTAIKQLLRAREMANFKDVSDMLWKHSLETASAAYVIAQRMSRINPDEALFAGLIHDLGAFYMLYRAAQYSELRARPDTLRYLVAQWHESIGVSLVEALDVPPEIAEAIRDHDQPRPLPEEPRTLADIVYVSNLMAGGGAESVLITDSDHALPLIPADSPYLALTEEIEAHAQSMRDIFD